LTEQGAQRPSSQDAMKKAMSFQMVYLFIMIMMVVLVSDVSIRNAIGSSMNKVLMPIIGFNYTIPLMTLFLVGILIGLITSVPRYFFTDWISMGRAQNRMKAFNKVYREAFRSNQKDKLAKLNKMRMDVTMEQQQLSMNTMKPLMILTVFIFLIYMWLFVYISALPYQIIATPWDTNINLATAKILIAPYWIGIYFIASLVIGYFATMVIKYIDFTFKLRKYEKREIDAIND